MFKPGEFIVCIDTKNRRYKGIKPKYSDVLGLTRKKLYIVLEPNNPYNTNVYIINDKGIKKYYSPKRFRRYNRKEKLNKITKIINDKAKKSIM